MKAGRATLAYYKMRALKRHECKAQVGGKKGVHVGISQKENKNLWLSKNTPLNATPNTFRGGVPNVCGTRE